MSSSRCVAAGSRQTAAAFRKSLPRGYAPLWSYRTVQSSSKSHAQTSTAIAPPSTNPALSFPCLDAREEKTAQLSSNSSTLRARRPSSVSGPEPSYTTGHHQTFTSETPLLLDWGGILSRHTIAYETWGSLSAAKDNAILLHTGLSASSHAHSTPTNPQPGWWEAFIGPGRPLDTDKYFIICTNVLGGCYGSTGPSSIDPANGKPYATRFPILTLQDMVRAQFGLLDQLGIRRLHASVGASMGGMQSLAAGTMFPERVGRVASISGCARSHPYSIAMRHTQRQVLMMDPNWKRGFYYEAYGDGDGGGNIPPHAGMKLAREIATVTYRSGPEWEQRFGRRRADPSKPPALCPDFLIETYLDHAGEKFCLEYDANSLLYVSKAMDLFDLGAENQRRTRERRRINEEKLLQQQQTIRQNEEEEEKQQSETSDSCTLSLPDQPYEEQNPLPPPPSSPSSLSTSSPKPAPKSGPPEDLISGLAPLSQHPVLILGVASDILFPAWQQLEVAETLRAAAATAPAGGKTAKREGNVTHVELSEEVSLFGHDTFLLDVQNVGGELARWLG